MKLLTTVTLIMLISSVWGKSIAAEFADGPVIFGYGKHAPVQQDIMLQKESLLKVVFDLGKAGEDGAVNRGFDSVARFLNMHVDNRRSIITWLNKTSLKGSIWHYQPCQPTQC